MSSSAPDTNHRIAVIEQYGWARNSHAVPDLIRDLADPDPLIRQVAALALGQIGELAAQTPLLHALRDPEPAVRVATAQSLGLLRDRAAMAGLIAALEDPLAEVRRAAAQALGRIRDGRAATALIGATHDPDPMVAHMAVRALKHLDAKRRSRQSARIPKASKPPHTKRTDRLVAVLASLMLTLTVLGFALAYVWDRPLGPELVYGSGSVPDSAALPNESVAIPPKCGGPQLMYLLMVGSDTRAGDYHTGFADVIRIVRIDFSTPSVSILTIPRDLWVRIPGLEQYGVIENRVKTAYAYGNTYDLRGGGPSLLVQTLSLNFGVRADHYVIVNFEAFVQGIDALGGIEVTVTRPVDGSWQELPYFAPGDYHMDGATALQYARIRENNTTDLYRIDRQTDLIFAIREKALSPQVVPALPRLAESIRGNVLTDLSPAEIVSLICISQKLEADQIAVWNIDYTMSDSEVSELGFEILIPDFRAINQLVERFNAGQTP